MGFVTLIKTAEESPSGTTLITSITEKEYLSVEEFIDILMKELYVFAIHGKDHKVNLLETRYTSLNAVFKDLSKFSYVFKRPIGDRFFDISGNTLVKFAYKCGYNDHRYEKTPGRDLDLRKEHEG